MITSSIDINRDILPAFGRYLLQQAERVDRFDMSYGLCGFAQFFRLKYLTGGSRSDLAAFYDLSGLAVERIGKDMVTGFEFADMAECRYFLALQQEALAPAFDVGELLLQLDEMLLSYARAAIAGNFVDPFTGGFRQAYIFLELGLCGDWLSGLIEEMACASINLGLFGEQPRGIRHLSVAHGYAFFLYFTCRCLERGIAPAASAALVRRIIAEIMACRQQHGEFGSWFPARVGERNGSRLNLCYGDAPILRALWRAARLLRDSRLLDETTLMLARTRLRRQPEDTGITDNSLLYGNAGMYCYYRSLGAAYAADAGFWKQRYLHEIHLPEMPGFSFYGLREMRAVSLLESAAGPLCVYMSDMLGDSRWLHLLINLT